MDTFSAKTKIYLLFFLSGASSLIYETVWLRILTRILGSTVYATSVVLASFMAGMAIGSFALGRYADTAKNKLRLFSCLEFGIGVSAAALTLVFKTLTPLYKAVYSFIGQERLALTLFQSCLMFFLLLIPASLMGGTLPVLVHQMRKLGCAFTERLGYLYGLNTLGACAGVAASGIYLIGALGESATLGTAIAINLLVGGIALSMSAKTKGTGFATQVNGGMNPHAVSPYDDATRKIVLLAYCLSGFAAISYEIVWARMFTVQVGTSIYAFSLMLAFYLLGIALGSVGAGRVLRRIKNPLALFGASQLFVGFYGILGMYLFALFKPAVIAGFFNMKNLLLLPALIVFPVTFTSGLVFPAVSESYVKDESRSASGVGKIYALNTLGGILGSLVCGFILIGLLGTRGTVLVLTATNIFIGIIVLYKTHSFLRNSRLSIGIAVLLIGILALGLFSPDPFRNSIFKLARLSGAPFGKDAKIYYHREAAAATTTVMGQEDDVLTRNLWINGIGMTSLCVETKLMAHLPILLHANPRDLLVVCFGMGTTLRSAWLHKSLKCDVVELAPQVYECFKYFHSDGPDILKDPRIRHYADDGRNFLLVRAKKYDIITVDPSPPVFSAGTVNLYSREFLELARARLNPEGILCLWVPPAPFSEALMIMKTFQSIFPNALVFRGVHYPGLYLLGFNSQKIRSPGHFIPQGENAIILKDLNEWGRVFPSVESLLDLFVLDPAQLAAFVEGERVITDDRPYTEFPLWRSFFDDTFPIVLEANLLTVLKKKMFGK